MEDPRALNARQFNLNANGKVTGVELTHISTGYRWELVRAELISEQMAQGNTVATVDVKDKKGFDTNVPCYLVYPWANWVPGIRFGNSLLPGGSSRPYEHVITNTYNPPARGPLAICIGDGNGNVDSDVIGGLGLPFNRHVSYHLVFRERGTELPAPTPGTGATLDDILVELRRISRHFTT